MELYNYMTLEILEILKKFIAENDLGPIKTFYAGDRPKKEYSELEKSRLKSLIKICEIFLNNGLDYQNLTEKIKKDLDISDVLASDISKKIGDLPKNSSKITNHSQNTNNDNKKSLFSVLVNEKK